MYNKHNKHKHINSFKILKFNCNDDSVGHCQQQQQQQQQYCCAYYLVLSVTLHVDCSLMSKHVAVGTRHAVCSV